MGMISYIKEELNVIKERDPAIKTGMEVLLYSSFKAILSYRVAHKLFLNKHYFLARWVSQRAARKTGIEIHPGATIGKGLFIDHGSGVIIGETTVIGDNVTLYQGVTLGGTGKEKGKRHPTLEDNVMVSAGAKILGSFTIGENSKIGAGSVVLEEVPPNCTVVGVPGRIVRMGDKKIPRTDMDQVHLPDPVLNDLRELHQDNLKLKKQLKELDINQIHDLMKISFKQSSLIYDYFHNEETFAAINLFNGVVFKQLDLKNYQKEEWDYLDKHLLINSPLYGILRYNDAVNYHRLEMKHKLNEINLYQYWYKELNDYLKNEDVILSLSTKEYEKMISHKMIQLDFVIRNGHTFKRNAVYLKKARGMMLNYLIKHHIEDIKQIKEIVIDDYHFSENDSNDDHWVFIKDEKMKYIKK